MVRKDDAALPTDQGPTEAQVLAYLKAHPDLLQRHPDLAARLAPPSRFEGAGPVVDLQAFMIGALKGELDQMRGCAEHLISTTRSNMSTQSRTHEAVLAVLNAIGVPELARVVAEELPRLLDVDVAGLAIELGDESIPRLAAEGIRRPAPGTVAGLLANKDHLLVAKDAGNPELFGDAASLVASSALVRLDLGLTCPPGLLVLGSRTEKTFHPGQGIELLSFLAKVVEHGVRRWLTA